MSNRLILIVAPSGAGKSTLLEKVIIRRFPQLQDVVTCTTRDPREGETQGKPYYFLTHDEFHKKIQSGYFVEWAKVHSQFYGTPKIEIEKIWEQSLSAIMDIDVQGALAIQKQYIQAKSVFILPPSIAELKRRILIRGKSPQDLELRLANAKQEIAKAYDFDYRVNNECLDHALLDLEKIITEILKSG